jgi:hypothetical protein
MAKIIKLNENDLKRIVIKVLNERRLNEQSGVEFVKDITNDLAPGAITKEVAEQLEYAQQEVDPIAKFQAICNVCISNKDGLGPLTQSESIIDGIVDKIFKAADDNAMIPIFTATDQDSIKIGIRNTKSFPDFCYMIDSYTNKYEDFYESMDGEFDLEDEQKMYLVSPLADVIKFSLKLVDKKTNDNVKVDPKVDPPVDPVIKGGGGAEDNWNMYMCVIEHPKAIGEKFDGGKRTRFRIGPDYYMGNGKKLRKGIELDYSCDDKEFADVDFADKDDEQTNRGGKIKKRPVHADVINIQKFLTDEGYDISADGEIGDETSGAIVDYIVDNDSSSFKPTSVLELQKKINGCYSMKIKVDGKVGPETLNAIADALESAQQGDLC